MVLEKTLEARVEEDEVKLAIESILKEDTNSYAQSETTTYNMMINFEYEEKTTKGTYYETATTENNTTGTTMTEVYSEKEHETLKEGQEVANESKQADCANRFYIEAAIDSKTKEAKDRIKLVSPALWQLMYNGKLMFN